VLLIVSLSSTIILAQSEKVVVAVDNGYPPYMYGTEKGAKGLYPRQIKAIFSRLGVEVDVQALPWKRALKSGEEGKAAVGGIYKNKKRLEIYDYSQPIFEETLAIYVRKGNAFPFKDLSDLKGKNIGINRGWSYGEAFDKARKEGLFKVQEANTNQANLQKLAFVIG
jgi:polar amino acid transport system substrate-binding protein